MTLEVVQWYVHILSVLHSVRMLLAHGSHVYFVATQDLAGYKIIGLLQNLEIAEIAARSGANCGSLFLDLRFRELVKTLLSDHPSHLDQASLAYFMHAFSETDKVRAVVRNMFRLDY